MSAPAPGFGPFTLDLAAGGLARDGAPVALGQRGLALLRALLDARGEPVSKADLMDRVWSGAFVEEGNLSVQVAGLRKALGKRPDGHEWIVNVPRVGYRLLTTITSVHSEIRRPSLAVMAFQNLTGDSGDDYFADGMVGDLITALSRFHSFAVVSRNASFNYRDRSLDPRDIARELAVRYVLAGNVRRAADRLRINVELVDGRTGAILWTEQFDGRVDDVFDFQDRITAKVATLVEPAIQSAEIERSRLERPGSVAVYDAYLRALADLDDESEAGNARAFALLEQALAVEPDNARLLGQAAWALEHRTTMGWQPLTDNDRERCLDLARRGIQHANGDPVVLSQCGMALLQTGKDYDAGLAVIRIAAEANPHDLHVAAVFGVATMHCGDLDEAHAHFHRALRIAPNDLDSRFLLSGLAMIHIIRGEYEEAISWASRSLALNAQYDPTYWMLIAANAHLGRMGAARDFVAQLVAKAPGVSLDRIVAGQPSKFPERIGTVLDGLRLAGLA
jgi:TolB-like protein/Tfp pilus assembly protein PilF